MENISRFHRLPHHSSDEGLDSREQLFDAALPHHLRDHLAEGGDPLALGLPAAVGRRGTPGPGFGRDGGSHASADAAAALLRLPLLRHLRPRRAPRLRPRRRWPQSAWWVSSGFFSLRSRIVLGAPVRSAVKSWTEPEISRAGPHAVTRPTCQYA